MKKIAAQNSNIAGQGVFILEAVKAGQVISEFRLEREISAASPLRPDLGERPEHCSMFDDRYCLVASPERFLNHSCNPNTYLRYDDAGITMVALCDIQAGTELSVDYLINNSGGDSWDCNCGSTRCRGETGYSFFTLPKTFQDDYFPLLAPWFIKRHANEIAQLQNT